MKKSTKRIALGATAAFEIGIFAWLASGHLTRAGALALATVSAALIVIACIPARTVPTSGGSANT